VSSPLVLGDAVVLDQVQVLLPAASVRSVPQFLPKVSPSNKLVPRHANETPAGGFQENQQPIPLAKVLAEEPCLVVLNVTVIIAVRRIIDKKRQ
jgi:hypothetical protein